MKSIVLGTRMDVLLIAAIVAAMVVTFVLVFQTVRTVSPGWVYEFRKKGRVVLTLDKPGLYLVNPFLSGRRVRKEISESGAGPSESSRR